MKSEENEETKTAGRLPSWLRRPLRTGGEFVKVQGLLNGLQLNTVCASAKCPNRHECWNSGTATIMILGNTCTRNCRFCNVTHGMPEQVDPEEPQRVAEAAAELKLKHAVITSVTRDDLPDGGATHFAAVIRALREAVPGISVEVLTPDFKGVEKDIQIVLDARPNVYNHNLETVRRLQQRFRPQASYETSLKVIRYISESGQSLSKSGLMLGMGETREEIETALHDLRDAGCMLLTLGQYLAPSDAHVTTERYVTPKEFDEWAEFARGLGFRGVASAPLVRSSYRAEMLMDEAVTAKN